MCIRDRAIELAEALIKHSGLSLREAHILVGALVKSLHESGKPLKDLDLKQLTDLAQRILGKSISLPEEVFQRIIDSEDVPKLRATEGASAPTEIQKMIEDRRNIIRSRRRALEEALKNLSKSRQKFEESLAKLLNRH